MKQDVLPILIFILSTQFVDILVISSTTITNQIVYMFKYRIYENRRTEEEKKNNAQTHICVRDKIEHNNCGPTT